MNQTSPVDLVPLTDTAQIHQTADRRLIEPAQLKHDFKALWIKSKNVKTSGSTGILQFQKPELTQDIMIQF